MRATMYGKRTAPVVTVVGVWDPFLPVHRQLFEELCSHARGTTQSSFVVVFDPAPPSFMHGAANWPVYTDITARLRLIQTCSPDSIMLIRFAKKDLLSVAADFLNRCMRMSQ